MAPETDPLAHVFDKKFNSDYAASLFREAIQSGNVQQTHIISHLDKILKNGKINVTDLIRDFKISLSDANDGFKKDDFLIQAFHSIFHDEFIEVVRVIDSRQAVYEDLIWDGQLSLLKFVHTRLPISEPDIQPMFMKAVKRGNLHIIKWLDDQFKIEDSSIIQYNYRAVHSAIEHGNIHIFQWLMEKTLISKGNIAGDNYRGFRGAAGNGHLAMLKWIAKIYNMTKSEAMAQDNYVFRYAAENGHIHVLKWLTQKFEMTKEDVMVRDGWAFYWAANAGRLAVLEWFTTEFNLTREDIILDNIAAFLWAASKGHLEILKWLTRKFKLTKKDAMLGVDNAFMLAAKHGHLEVLQWITKRFKLEKSDALTRCNQASVWSIQNGHISTIEWLYKHFGMDPSDISHIDFTFNSEMANFIHNKLHPRAQSCEDPITAILIDIIGEVNATAQMKIIKRILSENIDFPQQTIVDCISKYCRDKNAYFYTEKDNAMLDRLIDMYNFKSMFISSIVEILQIICAPEHMGDFFIRLAEREIIARK